MKDIWDTGERIRPTLSQTSNPLRLLLLVRPLTRRETVSDRQFQYSYCFRASVASDQNIIRNLTRIYSRRYEFSNSSLFYQSALHLTRVHCATRNTSNVKPSYFFGWIPVRSLL